MTGERLRRQRRHRPLGGRPHHLQAHTPRAVLHERKSRVTLRQARWKDCRRNHFGHARRVRAHRSTLRKSITFDNDTAFAQHGLLRTMRAMTTWFCDAYASWQKGGVENANGRLRRWLPRQSTSTKCRMRKSRTSSSPLILRRGNGKRGKFPGERRWIYAGAGRMRLARGGIFGPGMPRRAPMNS